MSRTTCSQTHCLMCLLEMVNQSNRREYSLLIISISLNVGKRRLLEIIQLLHEQAWLLLFHIDRVVFWVLAMRRGRSRPFRTRQLRQCGVRAMGNGTCLSCGVYKNIGAFVLLQMCDVCAGMRAEHFCTTKVYAAAICVCRGN